MSEFHGKFVWYELMTTDTAAAAAFYGKVAGWTARDSGMPGMAYTMLAVGEHRVGGLLAVSEEAARMGARPGWISYVFVDDCDAAAARIVAAGGAVHHGPADIPGIGRFAVVADPQGAAIAIIKGEPPADQAAPPAPPAGTPGTIGWHELYANDGAAAFAFYADMFGWTKGEGFDMGPMGLYQLFLTGGTDSVGGMMTRPPFVAAPRWLYYINVEAIDAALERVTTAGGQILHGPTEVPGGSWIVQCMDPQGAQFALVAPRR